MGGKIVAVVGDDFAIAWSDGSTGSVPAGQIANQAPTTLAAIKRKSPRQQARALHADLENIRKGNPVSSSNAADIIAEWQASQRTKSASQALGAPNDSADQLTEADKAKILARLNQPTTASEPTRANDEPKRDRGYERGVSAMVAKRLG